MKEIYFFIVFFPPDIGGVILNVIDRFRVDRSFAELNVSLAIH